MRLGGLGSGEGLIWFGGSVGLVAFEEVLVGEEGFMQDSVFG